MQGYVDADEADISQNRYTIPKVGLFSEPIQGESEQEVGSLQGDLLLDCQVRDPPIARKKLLDLCLLESTMQEKGNRCDTDPQESER